MAPQGDMCTISFNVGNKILSIISHSPILVHPLILGGGAEPNPHPGSNPILTHKKGLMSTVLCLLSISLILQAIHRIDPSNPKSMITYGAESNKQAYTSSC